MSNGTRSFEQDSRGTANPAAAHADRTSPAASSSNLTVDGFVHPSAETVRSRGGKSATSSGEGKKEKRCCACGKDVAHEERFKDRAGYYWCMDCGVQENRAKHTIGHAAAGPVACGDCSEPFPADQLVERDHLRLCPGCAEKREQFAAQEAVRDEARQAARKAAAAREYLDAERRRHRLLVTVAIVSTAVVLCAVYAVAF